MAAADLLMSLLIYYVSTVLNRAGEFPIVTGITIISQLIGARIWAVMARRTSKMAPLKIGALIWMAGMAICFFLTSASPPFLLYVAEVCTGLGGISCNQVPWSVAPDVVDVGELITGRKEEGVYSGMITFIRQAANGLMLGCSGILLHIAGYAAPAEAGATVVQSAATIRNIRYLFVFAPFVFLSIALLLAYHYPLTRKRFTAMQSARQFLRVGKTLEDPELRADIRSITGIETGALWKKRFIPLC
jgi:GPH family glycoside/pentoside/hexuronide:cation symporter